MMRRVLQYLLLITLITATFQSPEISPEITAGITAVEVVLGVLLLLLLALFACIVLRIKRLPRALACWLPFSILAVVNIVIALANDVRLLEWGTRTLQILAWPACALVTFIAVRSERELWSIYRSILWILTIPLVCSVIILLQVPGLLDGSVTVTEARMATPWNEKFGHFASLVLLLSLPFLRRPWAIGLGIFSGMLLVLSGIRSLLIGAFGAGLLLSIAGLVQHLHGRKKTFSRITSRIIIMSVLAFFIVSLLSRPLSQNVFERIILGMMRFQSSISFRHRVNEAYGIFISSFENPLLALIGNGAGASFRFFSIIDAQGWREQTFSHNFYLYLWWAYGLLGFLSWLGAFFLTIRLAWPFHESRPLNQSMLLGLLLAFVGSALTANLSSFYDTTRWYVLFGIFTGLTVAIRYRKWGRTEAFKA